MSDDELPDELVKDIKLIDDHYNNREELMGSEQRTLNLKQALERVANALRDARYRLAAGMALFLPIPLLTGTLEMCSLRYPLHERYGDCCAQVGRAVANLVADCDANRVLAIEGYYVDQVNVFLQYGPPRVKVPTLSYPFSTVKPIIASLLNLVVDGHTMSINALGQWPNLHALLYTARQAAKYTEPNMDDEAAIVVEWICDICMKVVSERSETLARTMDTTAWVLLTQPFGDFTTPEYRQSRAGSKVVGLSGNLMELLSSHEDIDISTLSAPADRAFFLDIMTRFVELGDLPEEWVYPPLTEDEEDDLSLDSCKLVMSDAKEGVIRSLVDLAALKKLLDPSFDSFWSCMRSWLGKERSDLLICALLSFGNSSRGDARATELLNDPKSILDDIIPLLAPTTEVKVQHALIGLLRNLSIPTGNKTILGDAGVIDKLIGIQPWSEDRDLVGSVQGGAIGVIKNLCRDSVANSQRFMDNKAGFQALSALMKRTDDQPIRFEATRIFVNVIRSICKDSQVDRDLLKRAGSGEVVGYLCEMLRSGGQMPVLVNEGVIALTLLVSFGAAETASAVSGYLTSEVSDPGEGTASALEVLQSVMAESQEATKGIRENCKVLRDQLLQRVSEGAAGRQQIDELVRFNEIA